MSRDDVYVYVVRCLYCGVFVLWRSRLNERLIGYTFEPDQLYSKLMYFYFQPTLFIISYQLTDFHASSSAKRSGMFWTEIGLYFVI